MLQISIRSLIASTRLIIKPLHLVSFSRYVTNGMYCCEPIATESASAHKYLFTLASPLRICGVETDYWLKTERR
jgi:hypothetical protein